MGKKEDMAAKMSKRNPLEKRAGIAAVDVLQKSAPEPVVEELKVAKKEIVTDDARTESVFYRTTKREKRLIKLHAIEKCMFTQDLISEAMSEYFKNHPL